MAFDIDVRRRIGDRDISLRFASGPGITILSGPSGAGKSSILNMIAGLIPPDRGHIRVNARPLFDRAMGIDIAPDRRNVGYVFQDRRLFPHRTVRANLLYGCPLKGAGAQAELGRTADFLGIGALLDRLPGTLSGGEAQRVAIGRAILRKPDCLLMDEPNASLDPARRSEIQMLVKDIAARSAIPILYVTHDEREADILQGTRIEMPMP